MERITRHFQEELDLLKTRLLEMGGLAEERVRHSVQGLADRDFALIDCQVASAHVTSLGASAMPRAEFLARLDEYCEPRGTPGPWR